jgi:hypothetical protein
VCSSDLHLIIMLIGAFILLWVSLFGAGAKEKNIQSINFRAVTIGIHS